LGCKSFLLQLLLSLRSQSSCLLFSLPIPFRLLAQGVRMSLRRCLSSSAGLPLGSKPTMEDAKTMPREYYEMPNEVLLTLAANGDYGAMEERLIREIMAVDDVTWDEAQPKFKEARRSDASSIADTPFTHPPRVLPRSSFPAARTREAEERAKKRARRAAERS
jgi:hypothetical protein